MAWETDSGFLDEFTGTVVDAFFETDEEYREGAPVLTLKFSRIEAEDLPTSEVPDEITQFYSAGKQFEKVDDHSIARVDGRDKGPNKNSGYGRFIDHALDAGALDTLKERGTERDAKVWLGLRFKLEPKEFSFKDRETGDKIEYHVVLPTEFLGVDDEAAPASSGTSESNGSSAPNRKKLEAQLKALAKKHDTHDDFLVAALELDGVTDDDELFEAVGDDSDEGFYAKATS